MQTARKQWLYRISFFCLYLAALVLLTKSIAFAAIDTAEIANEGAITGKLTGTTECAKAQNQIWISVNSLLLYHTDLPNNGTFEFHVKPGKYNVIATGSTGCFYESAVEVKKSEKKEVAVSMVLNKKGKKK